MNHTFKEIANLLAQRAEEVVRYLFPDGKREGNEWCIGDIDGSEGKSLKIHLTGPKAGIWNDFADGSTKGGDLLDLWGIKRNLKPKEALKEAKRFLGIGSPVFVSQKTSAFVTPKINSKKLKESSPVYNYLSTERQLESATIEIFQVHENDNMIVFPYIREGEIFFAKKLSLERPNGKKKMWTEANCEPGLFGWQVIPDDATTITICEGEIDAMSLYQCGVPALSVPFGAGSGDKNKWIEYEFDRLAPYNEIFLCFDADETGKSSILDLAERLGRHRCRVVQLPFKDPNECLQKSVSREEILKCFEQAKTLDPQELKCASIFVDKVIDEFYPPQGVRLGYNPPWMKAQNKILFRPSELSVWTGINGHGKSQFLGQIILSCMRQGAKVCIASLELRPERLLMRLTRQVAGLATPSQEDIRAIHQWYKEKLLIFDLLGTAKAQRLLDVFKYARQRYGVDVFVIDSFLKLDIAEDDYKSQKEFIEKLCDFKNEYNCHVHVIVHPRKSSDETQPPNKLDCKGTGAITDLADNCFCIWRNKKKEDLQKLREQGDQLAEKELEILKSFDCLWICDKQRNGDWEGKLGLWFEPNSYQYLNNENQRPTQYVDFLINVAQDVLEDFMDETAKPIN